MLRSPIISAAVSSLPSRLKAFFIDQNEGWATTRVVCYGTGKVLHTTDNFNTWDTLCQCGGSENSSCGFYSIYFKDAVNGWMLSFNCYSGWWTSCGYSLRKTIDGGNSWEYIDLPTTLGLNSLCFTQQGKGCIVGSHGIILNTNNCGGLCNKLN